MVLVPLEVAPDLDHWLRVVAERVGVPMGPRGFESMIYTDASLLGWGAIMGQNMARGLWPRGPLTHLNALEMEAMWKALQHFASFLEGRHILIMTV